MDLVNSKRMLYSASHVSLKLSEEEQRALAAKPAGALATVNLLRALSIDRSGQETLRERVRSVATAQRPALDRLLSAAAHLERDASAHLAVAASISDVSRTAVLEFARLVSDASPANLKLKMLTNLFEVQLQVAPIGRLYLERLEMFPVGVERGELVFTVPMAPGESTTISHKEWSVSTRGYEDVVQDFFESYSEQGVTEKTDSSSSAETEVKRSNTLNFGATLSGSYGPVSLTTNLGLATAHDERSSVKSAMQANREVTEKSSARVRQEHKVSIKIESKQGLDDSSFKTISNPSLDAVRIDYYKMMRKWRTDLFRYGLRMTYDITVPSPGVRLWARWKRLSELDAKIAAPFVFGWTPDQINEGWIFNEAIKFGLTVEGPPPFTVTPPTVFDKTPFFNHDDSPATRFGELYFDVPPGYHLGSASFIANIAVWDDIDHDLNLLNASDETRSGSPLAQVTSALPEHIGRTGRLAVSYAYAGLSQAALRLDYVCVREKATFEAWQKAVWHQLRDASIARHNEDLVRFQTERDALWRALAGKDTLSLRRLEREEMLRLIMLWILGPSAPYANAPTWIEATVDRMLADEVAFLGGKAPATPSPTFDGISATDWARALMFGDLVKFVQQAIEWENLLYILYPYFWGAEAQGRDKMLFEHPDPLHTAFLRAGYSRFVVTVRPGFEEDFTRLVETGSLGGTQTSPYFSVAEEIAATARTNYAGIPPANPELHSRPLLYPQQRQSWATMEKVIAAIDQFKADHGALPSTLADLPAGVVTKDAWGNDLVYTVPGSGNDYDLISLGSNGVVGGEGTAADISAAAGASLMASWFDYTPTSGVDIVLNTAANVIA
jgi:DNA-binding transcriptional regulator/RsmH inhibitor MraZ